MTTKINLFQIAKDKHGESFLTELKKISDYLDVKPEWLLTIFWYESGLNTKAKNNWDGTGSTGLIQFVPATAQRLGTSVNELYNMTATEQLYYVQKYYEVVKGKMKKFSDMYLFNFAGAYTEPSQANPDNVLLTGAMAYAVSPDHTKNGVLNVAGWRAEANDRYKKAWGEYPDNHYSNYIFSKENIFGILQKYKQQVIISIIILILILLLWRK